MNGRTGESRTVGLWSPDQGPILRGFQFIQHETDSKLTQQFQRRP
jgi:hypothetical protein